MGFKDAVDWRVFEVVMPIESPLYTINSNQFFLNCIAVKIPETGHVLFKLFTIIQIFHYTLKFSS